MAVRKRPLNAKEKKKGNYEIIKTSDENQVLLHDPKEDDISDLQLKVMGVKKRSIQQFSFDKVFDEFAGQ